MSIFPIARLLNSSAAIVWGQEAYSTDSKFIRISFNIFKKIYDFKWWLKYRICKEHQYHIIRTGLEPRYYDIDTIMLHGNMTLLCRYVEDEREGEKDLIERIKWLKGANVPCDDDEEIWYIYRWWKNDWKEGWDYYNRMLDETFSGKIKTKPVKNNCFEVVDFGVNPNAKMTPEQLHNYEESLYQREEEMLCRLIKVRRCLWT